MGAGQSGTIGYFRDNVVNLDGKVNIDAIIYRNNMQEYLRRQNIIWYCDWDSKYLGVNPEMNGWFIVEKKGAFTLYHFGKLR